MLVKAWQSQVVQKRGSHQLQSCLLHWAVWSAYSMRQWSASAS